jgi:hypothetical protein
MTTERDTRSYLFIRTAKSRPNDAEREETMAAGKHELFISGEQTREIKNRAVIEIDTQEFCATEI